MLSSDGDHDSTHAIPLLQEIDIKGSNILGDKAYGAKEIREYITSQGATYTIPPREKCDTPWPVDWHTYKERHLIECFFQKLKWFRRILTRYYRLDASFLAFVYIGAIFVYFAGQISAEECAKAIQSRASIYLSEQCG